MSDERALPALEPRDEHNRELEASVRPPDWVNPDAPREPYDLVVLGAGTAGLVTAAGAAGLGARVALIERDLLGGDCLNVGCVPSKALIRCARAAADARDAARFGVVVEGDVRVDFPAVMERMRRLRAGIAPNDSAARFSGLGVDVYLGEARFEGPRAVDVGGKRLPFRRAVIATGARASAPPIPGLEEAGYLTNETLFSLTELPRRLAIVGGGPIGCEMAQSFARFGAQVHLVERDGQVLGREDRDAAELVAAALRRDGVELLTDTSLERVSRRGDDELLHLAAGGETRELAVDEVLVAVGRAPNVESLELERAGVEVERRGVVVDDHLRTSNPRVFAAGDVASRFKFTHTADAQARIVIQNALFALGPFGRARNSALTVPWVTYTDPELAHVGLHARDAEERDIELDTFEVGLDDVDRAILDGDGGFLRVHARRGSDEILGATLVARHAGEMISEVTLAMTSGAGLKGLAGTIHPYPTQADALRRAGDAYNKTRLTPGTARLLGLLMRLKR